MPSIPAVLSDASTEYVDVDVASNLSMADGTAEVGFSDAATVEPTTWLPAIITNVAAVAATDGEPAHFTADVRFLVGSFNTDPTHILPAGEGGTPRVHHEWLRLTAVGSPERIVRYAGPVTIT